jgi:hypothetical protein
MPIKLKRIFEKEYGKKKGDRIFYARENKIFPRKTKTAKGFNNSGPVKLILSGNRSYINTRRRLRIT